MLETQTLLLFFVYMEKMNIQDYTAKDLENILRDLQKSKKLAEGEERVKINFRLTFFTAKYHYLIKQEREEIFRKRLY